MRSADRILSGVHTPGWNASGSDESIFAHNSEDAFRRIRPRPCCCCAPGSYSVCHNSFCMLPWANGANLHSRPKFFSSPYSPNLRCLATELLPLRTFANMEHSLTFCTGQLPRSILYLWSQVPAARDAHAAYISVSALILARAFKRPSSGRYQGRPLFFLKIP